jgi:nucleoside-diphosphate-sugar epimerase
VSGGHLSDRVFDPELPVVALTGGAGFLGGAIAAELAARGRLGQVLFLIRADSAGHGRTRMIEQLERFDVPAEQREALREDQFLPCDLTRIQQIELDPRLAEVTHVVSCAALATHSRNPKIHATNVDGVTALAGIMMRRARLQRFLQVGTGMSVGTGLRSPIQEDWSLGSDATQLVPYTASKLEAERRLKAMPGLPFVAVRPSIIVGHSQLGCKPSASIFWVFRMAHALQAFTIEADERIDVVPVDFCARAIVALLLKPHLDHDLYNVSAHDSSNSFREIDAAWSRATGEPTSEKTFRSVGLMEMPRLVPKMRQLYPELNRLLMLQALTLYAGFAELNYVFSNERLLRELRGDISPPPPLVSYLDACIRSTAQMPIGEQMHFDFKAS